MARRHSGSKKSSNNDMGCLMAMFEIPFWILVILFSSGDPTARKVAWGIIGFIAAFAALTSMGASGGVALVIIIVVAVIVVIVIMAADSSKTNGTSKSGTSPKYDSKGSDIVFSNQKTAQKTNVECESFDAQLMRMQTQARNVTGQRIGDTIKNVNRNFSSTVYKTENVDKYVKDIEVAREKYNVPESAQKVLIATSQIPNVDECPVLMWAEAGKLFVLALLNEPVLKDWVIASLPVILFEKFENVKQKKAFEQLKTEPIGNEFLSLLSDEETSYKDIETDGLFTLPNGIKVTRASGKSLFEVLPDIPFYYVDGITQSQWYPSELRDLYQQHILLDTRVLSQEEYDQKSEIAVSEYISKEKDDSKAKQHLSEFKELHLITDEVYTKYLNMIVT